MLERLARDKHASLLRKSVNYSHKKFLSTGPYLGFVAEGGQGKYRYYHIMIVFYFTVGSTSSGSAFVIAPKLGAKTIFESISL
jgi:hypothetical protein